VLVAAAIVVVVVLAGSGGSSQHASTTTRAAAPETSLSLTLGKVSGESAGLAALLSPAQAQQIVDAVNHYVEVATVGPLRSGQSAGDLSPIFDTAALARVTAADRAVMVDDGLPRITGRLRVSGAPVDLVALGDKDSHVVLVSASIDLDVVGVTGKPGGPLHIVRTGELVFAPDAAGAWKVTSYDVHVDRSGAGLDTTSSTTSTTVKAKR
jgi:hypothetical protein